MLAFSFCASIPLFVISIVYLYKNRHISPHIYWCVLLTVFIAPTACWFSIVAIENLLPQGSSGLLTPKASTIIDLVAGIVYFVTCFAVIWCCLKIFFNCSERGPLLMFGLLSCSLFGLGLIFTILIAKWIAISNII